MLAQTPTLHGHTPTLIVTGPSGLTVRSVGYCRIAQGGPAEERVSRTTHDPAGRAIAQWDPRLFRDASAPANLASIYSLSGKVLSTTSIDAGWCVNLLGEADQLVRSWDGRGSQRRMKYNTLLRPQAVFEQALDEDFSCTERYLYGTADPAFAERNQCGQLIRHDDPAGTQLFGAFGLTGVLLEQIQHFLRELDSPDWPEALEERNRLLEPGEGATTRSRFNPSGELIEQSDAKGNRQFFSQTVGGQLRESHLQLKGQADRKTLVTAIQYNAHGQTERETAGNGVITTLEYCPADGRLTRLQARRGGGNALQALNYCYDPVGNVRSIEDAAQPIRYFANQRIDPISRYVYDSLYQLIEATGWEAGGPNKGPQFSDFDDPAPRANYRQTYRYDEGGNLLELTHDGPQNHGRTLTAARHSNRCLPEQNGRPPSEADIAAAFDANGNLLKLQPGQALSWDLRNQLKEVRPVERDSGVNDSERYSYGADGMRRCKVRSTQTNARAVVAEVRYLPGLEIRTHSGTGEELHVVVVQAGRSGVRVLHWSTEPPKDISNNQYRYNLMDYLGSCMLELDSEGEVISQERYHPFGSTAWFAGRGEVEASYKTVRYSGKERDATGLYYYGFRYYVQWWQRWLNPDPAGRIDGLNVYAMTLNNPISFVDRTGTNREVPKEINWVWLGSPLPTDAAININNVVNAAPDYDATLWVDNRAWSSGHSPALENLSKRVRIANVSDAFQGLGSKVHAAFERERSGPLKNYPSASDIARVAVLSKGGLYLDVDVELAKPLPKSLTAPRGLLARVTKSGSFHNAILAAPKDSPVIDRALASITNEYSDKTSSTWMSKRAYPGPAHMAAQREERDAVLHSLKAELIAMVPVIKASSSAERPSLLAQLKQTRDVFELALGSEPEHLLPSARVTETIRITGPEMLFSALRILDDSAIFESNQFQNPDTKGGAIFRRPTLLRRASFS